MLEVHHRDEESEARAGAFATPSGRSINTPGLLLYTRRGGPVNLTPDLLEELRPQAQALQLDVLHFLKYPSPQVVSGHPDGARAFLSLPSSLLLLAAPHDPCVYEFSGTLRRSTDVEAAVATPSGGTMLTPARYVEAAAALRPDAWVVLSDATPADCRQERAVTAVRRSADWLAACLDEAARSEGLAGAAAFGAVQGGRHVEQRAACAEAVAARADSLAGVVLAGLGTGETRGERAALVAAALRALPARLARLASTVGGPEEVLAAVAQGIDLFDCSYLAEVTAAGYALDFPLDPLGGLASAEAPVDAADVPGAAAAAAGRDDTKLCLWAAAHRADKRPLVPGCGCAACGSHSRAYLHHLLHTHEMLAQVLLEVHNTWHYLRFFEAVRAALAAGRFGEYRNAFLARKQRWLAGGAAAV